MLRIALIGVLCSCEDYDEISDLIEDREEEFKERGFFKLTNGVPSGDTIRRVVEAVKPEQMRASLVVCRDNIISALKGSHVIIDGKKLRGRIPRAVGVTDSTFLTRWSPIWRYAWQKSVLMTRPMN